MSESKYKELKQDSGIVLLLIISLFSNRKNLENSVNLIKEIQRNTNIRHDFVSL